MTLPTREWSSGGFDSGSYPRWDTDVAIEAEVMISDLLTAMLPQWPDGVSVDRYTIFTMESPSADPVPRFSNSLALTGTASTPGWFKAVQLTITALDTEFKIAKLVLLDSGSFNTYDKLVDLGESAVIAGIYNEWADSSNGWSSRNGKRPASFKSATKTLNEKLRREYRMT